MSDFLSSIRSAFNGQPAKSLDDPSNVVVDHPEQGFVIMPAEAAQQAGLPALLGIKPSQVPKDADKRAAMTALYRKRKAERIAREQAQEAKRATADAEMAEKNKPFLERQARRAETSVAVDAANQAAQKAPSIKALQTLQRFTDAEQAAPRLAIEPQPAPAPTLDVSPVGRAAAPMLPRPLPAPQTVDADRAALLALAGAGQPRPQPVMPTQAPVSAPKPMAVAPPAPRAVMDPVPAEPEPEVDAPVALQPTAAPKAAAVRPVAMAEEAPTVAPPTPFAMPPARDDAPAAPVRDFAALAAPAPVAAPMESRWDESFAPDARVTPDDRAALLALASGKAGRPLNAPAGAMGGDATGSRLTRMLMPQSDAAPSMDARDAAALQALIRAQRSDEISSGIGALGDVFGQARDLILNRPLQQLRQRGTSAVEQQQQQQELLAAQEKARLDGRLADATVAAKKGEAAKREADLQEANAKAKKTAEDEATAAALRDPTSPQSARVRELAIQLLGQRVDTSTWDKLSGAEIKDIGLKYGVPVVGAEAQAGLGARRIEQTIQDQRDDNYFKKRQLDLDIAQLELARERLKQQGEDTDAARDLRERLAKLEGERKDLEHQMKVGERNVGGFTFDPSNPPSADASKKMADVSLAATNAKRGIEKLRNLYAKHGTEVVGSVSGEMGAEWKAVTDQLRNIGNMGVPNGKDYEMLALELPNPTEASDFWRSKSRVLSILDTVNKRMDDTVDATAYTYKFKRDPVGGRTTPAASLPTGADGNPTLDTATQASPPVRPALKTVGTSSQGVRTVSIPKEFKGGDLKAALAEGETVRYSIGGGKYQVDQKKNGKLIHLRVEDK